jgi:hypothetical protein
LSAQLYSKYLQDNGKESEAKFVLEFVDAIMKNKNMVYPLKDNKAFDSIMINFSERVNMFVFHELCEKESDFVKLLQNTKFYGIGQNDLINPKYFHSALNNGCVPIHIRQENDEPFWSWLFTTLNLVEVKSKEQGGKFMEILVNNPEKGSKYAAGIHSKWMEYVATATSTK